MILMEGRTISIQILVSTAQTFDFYREGEIHIGNHSYVGSYSTIQVCKNQKIVIGNFA
jgi:hypothetical protein